MERLYKIIYRLTVILLFIILFFFAIIEARQLLYPLVLAILFAYLLYPVGSWLEKRGVHRIAANFIVIIFAASIVAGCTYLLYNQVSLLIEQLPALREKADENIENMAASISSGIGVETHNFKAWVNEQLENLTGEGGILFNDVFSSTTSTVTAFGLMPVYIFLFLYYRDKFYNFFFMIWPSETKERAKMVIEKVSHVTKNYMRGVFTVVLILCVINSFGLLLIGIRFAILLGIISAFCNFIPYFGTLIGAVFPLLMAVFTGDSPRDAMWVVVMFIIVQFTENNILTPNITGGSVQINPFFTIISIIAGGMVWGLPGMFVVVPVVGMLKIVLESNSSTKPIAFLIGPRGTERHAITIKKIKALFRKKSGK